MSQQRCDVTDTPHIAPLRFYAGAEWGEGAMWYDTVWFVCGWQVKLCGHLVTHGPYLSALQMHHDKALYFTLLSDNGSSVVTVRYSSHL